MHKVEHSPLSRVFYEVYASPDRTASPRVNRNMKRAQDELGQYVESAQMEVLGEPVGKIG